MGKNLPVIFPFGTMLSRMWVNKNSGITKGKQTQLADVPQFAEKGCGLK